MLLIVPFVFAHPGSASGAPGALRDYIGHRVEIVVGADVVDVRYVAEVPERRVLEEARGSAEKGYGTRLLDTLADELKITWDGAPVPAERVAIVDAVKAGDGGFLDFAVALHAALPGTTGKLGLRNGNYPGDPGFFATSVALDGSWMVDETSLLKVKNGRVRDNWHGAWVKEESAREPWIVLRPASFLERASAPEPLPQRMTGVDRDDLPIWAYGLLGVGLLPIALFGRWLGQRARRLRERG